VEIENECKTGDQGRPARPENEALVDTRTIPLGRQRLPRVEVAQELLVAREAAQGAGGAARTHRDLGILK
jgi:hypothetical protein